jgi:diguanylate cyclase (GGDEF)-like protein
MKNLKKIYILLFLSIVVAISYLFISTEKIQEKINLNVETIFIDGAKSFSQNIDDEIRKSIVSNPFLELKKNKELQKRMQQELSVIANDTYKYIFVLYRDKHDNYRYLLDGSRDKANFNQRLSVDKKMWNKVYDTQKPLLIHQNKLDNLWLTYLKPVVFENQTKAIIAIDFSTELPTDIYNAIEPLNQIFLYIFLAIGVLILILIYQSFISLRIKKESITDPLTQAYNRNYLRDFLNHAELDKYQIMMLDIDHFKQVNDNYGHKAGDFILSQTAKTIQKVIGSEDVLVRFGGEEFLVFIKKSQEHPFVAQSIAQNICDTVEALPFNFEDKEIRITLSIGVACNPERFKDISSAIKHADKMLYIAKRGGRNQVISKSSSSNIDLNTEKKSINDVKEALEENRIICFYQSIYNVKKEKIIKYEALVRLEEKDGSITPPFQFLESIMYTNVYNDLTKRVLEHVFKQIQQTKIDISVNLNFSDILDNKIYNLILEELEKNKEFASWLVVELLEYELVEELEIILVRLLKIKEYGVKIAVDDFGSGYSNYAMFQTLPIDILKIDGSLIKDIDSSEISYKITNSIVLLAKELGITTVAEFVHSEAVYDKVKSLEIDDVQGYYIAKPEPKIVIES